MFESKRVLAVVPARGGSKGVPLKNIKPALGVPLLVYTARTIQQIDEIDRAVVSTDHDDIASIAEKNGLAAPFRRPDSISGDRIGDIDVLVHALQECERIDGVVYDIVLMLQPTSPVREPNDILNCLRQLVQQKLDAVWTVSPLDVKSHPFKQLVIKNGALSYFTPEGKTIIARQQLEPTYIRNGICYAITRACLLEKKSIFGDHAGAVVIEHPVFNIDTTADFADFENYLKQA